MALNRMARRVLRRVLIIEALAVLFLCLSISLAMAQEPSVAELMREVKALSARVAELEAKLQEKGHTASTSTPSGTSDSESAAELIEPEMASSTPTTGDSLEELLAGEPEGEPGPDVAKSGQSHQDGLPGTTTVGGHASLTFENFENLESSFEPDVALTFASEIHPRLHFMSEVELQRSTSHEFDDGSGAELDHAHGTGDDITLQQAWLQYDISDNIGIRAGAVLVPFGKYNLLHDEDIRNLTDRPVVDRSVVPTTWSDTGVGFASQFELGDETAMQAEAYVINGLNNEFDSGAGGLRDARNDVESDNNSNKAVVGRVSVSPGYGYEAGLSGYTGAYDDDGNSISGGAMDFGMTFGDFQLLGEAAVLHVEDGVNESGESAPEKLSGVFAELNYRFWFESLSQTVLGESFEDPHFVTSFRYNYAAIESREQATTLDEDSYVVGLAYRPSSNFVFKTEWQWNSGELERRDSNGFVGSIAMGF